MNYPYIHFSKHLSLMVMVKVALHLHQNVSEATLGHSVSLVQLERSNITLALVLVSLVRINQLMPSTTR